jgi:hypothetical protein
VFADEEAVLGRDSELSEVCGSLSSKRKSDTRSGVAFDEESSPSPFKRATNDSTLPRISLYPRIQVRTDAMRIASRNINKLPFFSFLIQKRLLALKLEGESTQSFVLLRLLRFLENNVESRLNALDIEELILNHV